ncbi:unnamed protein product [Blepharisma stoltei]|uniref:Uncharacterized protein n=1 Tax=Blepharisma stoltei TaxID=1481888 RepID=A0AAU9J5W4_9CILI|nr:unnamed protein product [Blepharisma stoltei]
MSFVVNYPTNGAVWADCQSPHMNVSSSGVKASSIPVFPNDVPALLFMRKWKVFSFPYLATNRRIAWLTSFPPAWPACCCVLFNPDPALDLWPPLFFVAAPLKDSQSSIK